MSRERCCTLTPALTTANGRRLEGEISTEKGSPLTLKPMRRMNLGAWSWVDLDFL